MIVTIACCKIVVTKCIYFWWWIFHFQDDQRGYAGCQFCDPNGPCWSSTWNCSPVLVCGVGAWYFDWFHGFVKSHVWWACNSSPRHGDVQLALEWPVHPKMNFLMGNSMNFGATHWLVLRPSGGSCWEAPAAVPCTNRPYWGESPIRIGIISNNTRDDHQQ